jgi:hypothetical protein
VVKINSSIIKNDLFSSLLFSTLYVVVLYSIFTPFWETNDDVFMSMCAHGYGVFNYGAPQIVFSNVVWGYIVRAIPTINGVLGYSIAQISLIVICGGVLIYFLRKVNYSWVVAFCVFILITTNLLLYPQFTKTAFFSAIISTLFLYFYSTENKRNDYLFYALIFGILSFCIRTHSFFMIYLFLPIILPIKKMIKSRAFIGFVVTMLTSISILYYIDYQSYNNQSYKLFNEFNSIWFLFTDYKIININLDDSKYKYFFSENDIELIGNFFFLHINSPQKIALLKSMVEDAMHSSSYSIVTYEKLKSLPYLIYELFRSYISKFSILLMLLATIMFIQTKSKKIFLMFILSFLIIIIFSLLGKILYNRVTFMLFAYIFLMSLFLYKSVKVNSNLISILIIMFSLMSLIVFYQKNFSYHKQSIKINSIICALNNKKILAFAGDFPFEFYYPVLSRIDHSKNLEIYAGLLNVFLPNGKKDDLNKICQDKLIIVAEGRGMKLLKTLFEEKYQKRLESVEINKDFNIWEVKCTDIDTFYK